MPSGKEGFFMDTNKDVTHLTSEERRIIETGIRNGSTKTAIAKIIGKDNSTVGKEIKLHRKLKHKRILTGSGVPGFSIVIRCSPARRALWKTTILSCVMFSPKNAT